VAHGELAALMVRRRGAISNRHYIAAMQQSATGSSLLDRCLAGFLVAGGLLLAAAAALHPVLPPDAASQLQVMAATPHWRAIHLTMIVGSALLVTGIWLRVAIDHAGQQLQLLLALAIIAAGVLLNAMNIAFMAGHGAMDAARFATGDPGVAAQFTSTHVASLRAAGAGNLAVAAGCALLGWVEWRDPSRPRWLAALAWLASVAGVLGVVFFDPASRAAVAAVAVLTVWAMATGALELLGPPAHARRESKA
jgi:hypothetical protein